MEGVVRIRANVNQPHFPHHTRRNAQFKQNCCENSFAFCYNFLSTSLRKIVKIPSSPFPLVVPSGPNLCSDLWDPVVGETMAAGIIQI